MSDPTRCARVAVTGPTMMAPGLGTSPTRDGSNERWYTFSTSGWIGTVVLPRAPAEEDSLQINIRAIRQRTRYLQTRMA